MSTQLTASIGSLTYNLADGINYALYGHAGTGMAPLHRLKENGSLQQGITDLGYRLDPRVFHVTLGFIGKSNTDYIANRAAALAAFRPSNVPIKLRFDLDAPANTFVSRQIDCFYQNGLTLDTGKRKGFTSIETIEFMAPDPTFYDPVKVSYAFPIGGSSNGLAIPLPVPFYVGKSILNDYYPLTYLGSYATFPTFRVYGPVTDLIIGNYSTGDYIDFTGTTIASGDYYDINCGYSINSITDSAGNSQFSKMVISTSSLSTLRIEAAPEVSSGINAFYLHGTSISSQTAIIANYYTRYIGI